MTHTVRVYMRNRDWTIINLDDWKNAPYGEFTKFIRTKFNSLYGIDDKEIHKVRVEVYGTKTVRYSTELDVYVTEESEIHDAIYDEIGRDTQWKEDYDYDDVEWDGDYYVESIDNGAYTLLTDKNCDKVISQNKYNPNQLCFNF